MHARDRGGDTFYPHSMHTVSSWVTTELSLSSVASVASGEKQHPPPVSSPLIWPSFAASMALIGGKRSTHSMRVCAQAVGGNGWGERRGAAATSYFCHVASVASVFPFLRRLRRLRHKEKEGGAFFPPLLSLYVPLVLWFLSGFLSSSLHLVLHRSRLVLLPLDIDVVK